MTSSLLRLFHFCISPLLVSFFSPLSPSPPSPARPLVAAGNGCNVHVSTQTAVLTCGEEEEERMNKERKGRERERERWITF